MKENLIVVADVIHFSKSKIVQILVLGTPEGNPALYLFIFFKELTTNLRCDTLYWASIQSLKGRRGWRRRCVFGISGAS